MLRSPGLSLEEVNLNKTALGILSGLVELCSFPKQTVPLWGGCGSGLGKNLLKAVLILDKCRGIKAHPLKKINCSELFRVSPSQQDFPHPAAGLCLSLLCSAIPSRCGGEPAPL